MDQVTGLEYGLNVSKWIKDHPEYLLESGLEGQGFTARRHNEQGQAVGSPVTALTLDELAALVDVRGRIDMDEHPPRLLQLLHDHGGRWRITESVSPPGWIAVQHSAVATQQVLLACSLNEMSEKLSAHTGPAEGVTADALPPGFVRAVLDDAKMTDALMDALEAGS